MSFGTPQGQNLLKGIQRITRFDTARGKLLPAAYKKFWEEWKRTTPTAVHYIPRTEKYERNPETGIVTPVQNIPIPLKFPIEAQNQMWGGEGVIKGFQKRTPFKRRVPHFWIPVLRRTVVKSEVLDEYFSMVVTDRAISLIHESHGFDHYLLKTPACDLQQLLPLRMKRRILEALQAGCPHLQENPTKQQRVLSEYGKYLEQYSPEEVEWYGLTYHEALDKAERKLDAENSPVPHKVIFRQKLLEQLRTEGVEEVEDKEEAKSWMSRLNPFSKTDKKENL